MPYYLRGWIRESGSLTRRMRLVAGPHFGFRRLGEGWALPARDEALCLGLPAGRYAWMREVWLGLGQTPQIFARTVVPPALVGGPLAGLKRLGDRPLGELIFGRRKLRRGALGVARLRPQDWLHKRAQARTGMPATQALWARRSVFRLDDRGLLVTEVFLRPWRLGEGEASQ
jgi:chorismate--pyruvate lyase